MLYAIRQIFLKGGTIKDAIAYVIKQTGNMPTKLEGLQMIKMYKDVQKNTAKILDFPRDRITPWFDKAGEMSTKGKDIVKEGLAGLEKKTLLRDSPEAISKITSRPVFEVATTSKESLSVPLSNNSSKVIN